MIISGSFTPLALSRTLRAAECPCEQLGGEHDGRD
jgi:hypothetical protein